MKDIQEILTDFKDSIGSSYDVNQQCLEDMAFAHIAGMQWVGSDKDQFVNKPKPENNKLFKSINRLLGQYDRMELNARIASASNEALYNLKARIDDATDHRIVQFGFNYLFFAEKPLRITQMHPYLHHNTFTENGNTLLGEFNIGKWLRPLQASFIINPNKKDYSYRIKRGDIYSYIRFDTDEKVELVNFDVTPKIEEIADSCLQMKQSGHKSSFSLDFCYKSFIMYKRNKAMLRELKAQGL